MRRLLWMIGVIGCCAMRLGAAEPDLTGFDVVVRTAPLREFANQPVVDSVTRAIGASGEIAFRWNRAQFDPRFENATQLAEALGRKPESLAAALMAEGAALGIDYDGATTFVAALDTGDAPFAEQVLTALQETFPAASAPMVRDGMTILRLGPFVLVQRAETLWVSNDPERLRRAIESAPQPLDLPNSPLLTLNLDLSSLRELPNLAGVLRHPAEDPGPTVVFGGWRHLFREFDHAHSSLRDEAGRLVWTTTLDRPDAHAAGQVPGYFHSGEGRGLPAPLDVPGRIYAATWHRNYSAMWDARRDLLTAEVATRLEEGDERAATQLEVFGTHLKLSELAADLNGEFQVVAARQQAPAYGVTPLDEFPAAAIVIGLKDENVFAEKIGPVARTFGLIFSGENRMVTSDTDYRGARLVSFALGEDAGEQRRGSSNRYNVRTTYAITRGKLIVGTTPELVRNVIDALADEPNRLDAGVTDAQVFSGADAADAVRSLTEALVRGFVLNQGWQPDAAHAEIDVWAGLLDAFGAVRTSAGYVGGGFRYEVTVDPAGGGGR